jgi:hypothetical protein
MLTGELGWANTRSRGLRAENGQGRLMSGVSQCVCCSHVWEEWMEGGREAHEESRG